MRSWPRTSPRWPEKLAENIAALAEKCPDWAEYQEAAKEWLKNKDDAEGSKAAGKKVLACVEGCKDCGCDADPLCKAIYEDADLLTKKSFWTGRGPVHHSGEVWR